MTTLQPSDYYLINKLIEDKLKHYNLIQPIDTTEGEVEYRKMLTKSMVNITKGKIYKCYYQKGEDAYTIIDDIGNMDKDWNVVCFEDKTYTHADFLAQEQGKELAPIKTEQSVEKYKFFTGNNDVSYEVLILGIESPEQANKIKEAIKQYLSTNKF
jgi:hypothetical protein